VRLRVTLVASLALVAIVALGAYLVLPNVRPQLPTVPRQVCVARTGIGTVTLDPDQMANAATIAAVGIRRGLPDQAVVVALATSLQEAKLRNLSGGDRDSVGLFQQRPSQGWGSREQIADQRYAAGKFYSALVRVRGWEAMRVTDAAQRVQKSAYPEAYEKWTDESGVLAEALIGRATRAVVCTGGVATQRRGLAAAEALGDGLRLDWGDVTTVADASVLGLVLTATDGPMGWRYAHWLVAHSVERGVARVRFGDEEWTARSGVWSAVAPDGAGSDERVVAEVYAAG
jgi:hypothetical protein